MLHAWLNEGTPEPSKDSDEYKTRFKHFQAVGRELYPDNWDEVRARNVHRITEGRFDSASDLTYGQLQRLIDGLYQLKAQRVAA